MKNINAVSMSSEELSESDVQVVVDVFRFGRLALGPKAREFEQIMAEYVGVKHAIAVSAGMVASQ